MAAPLGHIVCALALLNSGQAPIADQEAFLAGTSFPDIRYVSDVSRKTTHFLADTSLNYVFDANTSFESGRRFHVFVDRARERHMRDHNAYHFVEHGPLKTQMLKLVEDRVLFDILKNDQIPNKIFNRIYDEEANYGIPLADILAWHRMLKIYLDTSYWFGIYRYFSVIKEYRSSFGFPKNYTLWQKIKAAGFFIYAYYQIERLSRDQELRTIILDFYQHKINDLLSQYSATSIRLKISFDERNHATFLFARLLNKT